MIYEWRRAADVDPLDDMITFDAPSGYVLVAVPDEADAIANLQAAGFVVEQIPLDDTSHVV